MTPQEPEGPLKANEFSIAASLPPVAQEVSVLASMSIAAGSAQEDHFDVVTPARPLRALSLPPDDVLPLDLSLEPRLQALQLPSGAFPLGPDLLDTLGLGRPSAALAHADSEDAELVATLLALKGIEVYRPGRPGALYQTFNKAEEYCTGKLGKDSPWLRKALDMGMLADGGDRGGLEISEELPGAELISKSFKAHTDWSSFEMWWRLYSKEVRDSVGQNTIVCPLGFLVSWLSAAYSIYPANKTVPVILRNGVLFIGETPTEPRLSEGSRQLKFFESEAIYGAWRERDTMLMRLKLDGLQVLYSSEPDAVEMPEPTEEEEARLFPEDLGAEDSGLTGEDEVELEGAGGRRQNMKVWRAAEGPGASELDTSKFVHMARTNHLFGNAGVFKKLKYWLQASLGACGKVVVTTSVKSGEPSQNGGVPPSPDNVAEIQSFTIDQLRLTVKEPHSVWALLAAMLKWLEGETTLAGGGADGAWILTMAKVHGYRQRVELNLRDPTAEEAKIADLEATGRRLSALVGAGPAPASPAPAVAPAPGFEGQAAEAEA